LAALAAGAVYAFSKFEEAENVMQQTDAVLKSTGGAAKVTSGHVAELADSISKVAGVDDEVIQSGENMLLTFKNIRNEVGAGNNIFDQAVQVTTDLAAGMAAASGGAINMKASSIQLGKALNDPILGMTSLTRVGVQFTEEQQKQIEQLVKHNNLLGAQKIILAEVSSQFAGSAEAQATASGKLSVAFENLAESVGGALAPVMTQLANIVVKVIGFLQHELPRALQATSDWFQRLWQRVGPVVTVIGRELWEAITQVWHVLQDQLGPALGRIWEALKKLWDAVGPVINVWLHIQAIWVKIALEVLPIVVAAIGFVIDILSRLLDAFMSVVDWVRSHLAEPIVGAIERIIAWIGRAIDWVRDRFKSAWQAIQGPVLAVIHAIISAVQTLIGWIKDAINFLSQLGKGVGQNLGGQVGGLLPPGFGGQLTPAAGITGSGSVEVTVNGWVGSDQDIARRVRDELVRLGERNVTSGIT
jgi:phage-related protein